MKVPPMTWGAVINALKLYTDTHAQSDVEVLTSEKVVDVLHNIDEHINNILETGKISKSKRSEVKKILQHLSSNIDKTVSFVNNPPDWLKKFFVQDLLYRIGVVEVEPDIRELGKDKIIELVKVLPVSVVIKNENKEVVDAYYLIYPDAEELKDISNISFRELGETLRRIYSRRLVIDHESKSIKLFEDTIFFSPDGFLTVISSLGLIDLKLIEEVVSNITSELSKYGKVTVDSELAHKSKIKAELTSLAEEMGKKHGVEFEYLIMIIEIDNRTKSGEVRFSGKYRIDDNSFGFLLEENELKRAHIAKCKVESCTVPEIKLKFNNLDELADNIRSYIDLARDGIDFIIRTTKLYYESAKKHGFTVSHAITNNIQTKKDGKHAYSDVEFSPCQFNVTVHGLDVKYEVSVRSKPHIIKYLKHALPSILNDNEEAKPSFYDNLIEIIGNVKIGKDLNFDSVFERVNTLLSTIDNIIDRATAVQSEKDSMKLPKEAYMALYLASKISSKHIDVKTVTGKPEVSVYTVVQSIGRKHGIEVKHTVLRDKYDALAILIEPLIKNKYITIDEHLNLYINGKPFTELLTTYFPAITRNDAIEIESSVIEEILRYCDSQRALEGKLLTQKLLELGLLNENVIRKIITSITTLLEPENFSIEVNGKHLWHQLSEETKQLYINGAYSPVLLNIFKDPSLKELFSDKINDIEKKILKDEIPSAITELVVLDKKYSHLLDPDVELIGRRSNGQEEVSQEEVLKKNSLYTPFLRPKYAKHLLVQIMRIDKDKHDFIVISTRTKDGFLIRARNVRNAVEIFEREYDRLHYILKKVNEVAIMKQNIEVVTKIEVDNYVYRYIQKRSNGKIEIIPINGNILDIIKSNMRKNENEEVVSA